MRLLGAHEDQVKLIGLRNQMAFINELLVPGGFLSRRGF
jgi:hypothetical protein